jgi:hypothetical protein
MPNTKFSQLPVTGNVTAATIVPVVESGVNYQVSGANLQAFVNNSTGNITGGNIVSLGAVTATGNVSGSYILGNGSLLTGIPASYGNANVAAYLPTFTGNLAGGNAIITNGVTAATFAGSGAALTNLPGANVTGVVANASYATAAGSATTATSASTATSATTAATVTTAAQPNITSVGTLSVLSTSGNISAVGNIAGSYFIGNGAALTGIVANTTYNDSNVAAFLPTYTGAMTAMLGNVTTTGNVQGAFVKGNGSQLTGLVSTIVAGPGISVSGPTGAVTITNNNPNAYTNSNVTSLLSSFGSNTISTTGTITSGNFNTSGIVSATGNITGANINGNGSGLTGIVTSIIAGSGISVNAATGAVTITNTGGGGSSTSISNGTSNVSIPTANGAIGLYANGGSTNGCQIVMNSNGVLVISTKSGANVNINTTGQTVIGDAEVQDLTVTGTIISQGVSGSQPPFRGAQLARTGTSSGAAGDICWDSNYIYVCTASNVWKRAVLSSF